jgi:rapamycin-insensitive companion of mTOR
VAVRFLDEVCEDPDVLHTVVEMQPTFEHLGEMAHPLLMKFVAELCLRNDLTSRNRAMSTPLGFRYLHNGGYIEREMDGWFNVSIPRGGGFISHGAAGT